MSSPTAPPPPSLPEGVHWFAVHTRSHCERRTATDLRRQGFEVFLPEYHSWSRRRDRRRRILKPLFPGYLFLRAELTPELRLAILQSRGVVRLVGVRARPVPVAAIEVESVRLLLGAAPDASAAPALRLGQRVQVLDGALRGVVGRVQETARGRRIAVTVELLGRSVVADLATEALAPYLE